MKVGTWAFLLPVTEVPVPCKFPAQSEDQLETEEGTGLCRQTRLLPMPTAGHSQPPVASGGRTRMASTPFRGWGAWTRPQARLHLRACLGPPLPLQQRDAGREVAGPALTLLPGAAQWSRTSSSGARSRKA